MEDGNAFLDLAEEEDSTKTEVAQGISIVLKVGNFSTKRES